MYELLLAAAMLTPDSFSCPNYILDSQQIEKKISGWDVSFHSRKRRLSYISVYAKQNNQFFILPPIEKKDGNLEWGFADNAIVKIECGYQDSALVLRREFKNLSGCVQTKKTNMPGNISFVCLSRKHGE